MSSLYTRLKITLGSADADPHALEHLVSDDDVRVTNDKIIEFEPLHAPVQAGVVFYQGGRCDPRAYAPVLKPLARAGYHVFVPQMALRLAVTGMQRAGGIVAAHPGISRWVIGGHSMGGAMAAAFVYKNPGVFDGLFFLASYASAMHAMPDSTLPMTMIYGTLDDVTRKSEFEASSERLPPHTRFVPIEGGDHYQFGSFHDAVRTATISREEQQRQTVKSLLTFLDEVTAD